MGWPHGGVYFFFDPADTRADSGAGQRIVRVGTHALTATSKASLWKRLSQHRGTASGVGGNHRGSIFRLLVGECLMLRDGPLVPTWACGASAGDAARVHQLDRQVVLDRERDLEAAVSGFIAELPFVWIPLDDGSARAFVERNAIALLSNFDRALIDIPAPAWLGLHSTRHRVRASGLWNNNHVDETHESTFLEVLAKAAREAVLLRC